MDSLEAIVCGTMRLRVTKPGSGAMDEGGATDVPHVAVAVERSFVAVVEAEQRGLGRGLPPLSNSRRC